ncbi:MAG: hypothetical protein AAGB10_08985 [Pseudomonadota bacterium]
MRYGQMLGRTPLGMLRGLGQRLWAYRGVCSVSIVVAALILLSAQVHEILVVEAEEWQKGPSTTDVSRAFRLYMPMILLSLLPNYLWFLARELYRWRKRMITQPGVPVLVICALPLLAILAQLARLAMADETDFARTISNLIVVIATVSFCLAVIIWRVDLRFNRRVGWLVVAAALLLMFLMIVEPHIWGLALGSLSIIALFAAMLATVAVVASWLEDEAGIPVTVGMIVLAVGFSWFDLNDNHYLRLVPASVPEDPPQFHAERDLTDIERRFLAWLDCRPGYAERRATGRKYRVVLVAAQGGGLYAAYQSASFLAGVQDEYPDFSSQVFAMSGVSGGSVGVSIFAALLHDLPIREVNAADCAAAEPIPRAVTQYRDAVDQVLQQDYLSSVGAALLFPDLLARFWPAPIDAADRATALERAFEHHYQAAVPNGEGLTRDVLSHWDWRRDTPMLLLNTTDVSTGSRMIVSSPLPSFPHDRMATYRQMTGCFGTDACEAPRLSTAMLLSARFPVVTPAGSVALPPCGVGTASKLLCNPGGDDERPKARFVDGGYYENSGLDTIADLVVVLKDVADRAGVEFTVISFETSQNLYPGIPPRAYGLGELGSPVRALNSSRSARVHPARKRVEDLGVFLFPVLLETRFEPYTLGWLLSQKTFSRINQDLYDPVVCTYGPGKRVDPRVLTREENCRSRRNLIDFDIFEPVAKQGPALPTFGPNL